MTLTRFRILECFVQQIVRLHILLEKIFSGSHLLLMNLAGHHEGSALGAVGRGLAVSLSLAPVFLSLELFVHLTDILSVSLIQSRVISERKSFSVCRKWLKSRAAVHTSHLRDTDKRYSSVQISSTARHGTAHHCTTWQIHLPSDLLTLLTCHHHAFSPAPSGVFPAGQSSQATVGSARLLAPCAALPGVDFLPLQHTDTHHIPHTTYHMPQY